MVKLVYNPVLMILLLIVFALVSVLLLSIMGPPTMDRVEWREEAYIVQSGDTLWAISDMYCPDNVDRREWIEDVRVRNRLTDSIIYPGQSLLVLAPIEED